MVYLRKMCSFISDTAWSDWSGPIVIGDTTGWAANSGDDSLRIAAVEQIEVALVPNPATERVTVAAEGVESVELVTVEGATVLRRDCRGECTLDLKGLANGTYMVHVTTAKGVATRKLIVVE